MTDTVKLREAISQKGIKYCFVAKHLGLSQYGLQKKIENDTEFKASEINKVMELLSLSPAERDAIFFA